MTFRLLKKSFHIYRGNISSPDFHSFTSCRILNKLATEGSRAKLSTVLDCSRPLESRLLAGFYTTQFWLFHLHVNLNSDAREGGGGGGSDDLSHSRPSWIISCIALSLWQITKDPINQLWSLNSSKLLIDYDIS